MVHVTNYVHICLFMLVELWLCALLILSIRIWNLCILCTRSKLPSVLCAVFDLSKQEREKKQTEQRTHSENTKNKRKKNQITHSVILDTILPSFSYLKKKNTHTLKCIDNRNPRMDTYWLNNGPKVRSISIKLQLPSIVRTF